MRPRGFSADCTKCFQILCGCMSLNGLNQLIEKNATYARQQVKAARCSCTQVSAETSVVRLTSLLWRNWLARSAVNRKVGGSNPPRSVFLLLDAP
ncbi:hypothetical protein RvY_03457 [Ramazzottius varieornatus]|uniref:Uncharacterized protein n=1 Tax=Ramazzottius varieornatus TaxID=947166 RepID=A0A1D1UXH2_RAMVA|nr:hypothetical protein RvY_03457 [Ramazzottius varieornatus]